MMGAARTSETSVDTDLITRQYIPEDSELNILFFISVITVYCNQFAGSIHNGSLLHPKAQYITVEYSSQLF
jgi:hypothetical protein